MNIKEMLRLTCVIVHQTKRNSKTKLQIYSKSAMVMQIVNGILITLI
jgi:hypothetical protein